MEGLEIYVDEEKSNDEPKDLDYVYEHYVGPYGLWQICIVILACLVAPSKLMIPLFLNSKPKVRCNMGTELEAFYVKNNLTFDEIHNITSFDSTGCTTKSFSSTMYLTGNNLKHNYTQNKCENGYIYEDYPFLYPGSIAKEWDLVCDRAYLLPLGTNLFLVGAVLGMFLTGIFGDCFGRKKTIILLGITEMACSFLAALSPNIYIFMMFRTFAGASNAGKDKVSQLLTVETTNASYRSISLSIWLFMQTFLSRSLFSLLAYFINNWRYLVLANNAPMLAVILCILFIPESPRWLLSKQRMQDAVDVIKIGKRFNRLFGKPRYAISETEMIDILRAENLSQATKSASHDNGKSLHCCSTFKRQRAIKDSILITLVCGGNTFSFYGLLYAGRNLRENIYLTNFYNSLMSVPATLICCLMYKIFSSRKKPLLLNFSLSILSLLMGGLYTMISQPENDFMLNICINICIVFCSASNGMLSVYIAELFPSNIRSRCYGIICGFYFLMRGFSVYVNQLDQINHGVPFIVFSCVLAIALIILLLLRDTDGKNLQDLE